MDDHLEAVSQSFIMTKELGAVAIANQKNTSHFAHYHIRREGYLVGHAGTSTDSMASRLRVCSTRSTRAKVATD